MGQTEDDTQGWESPEQPGAQASRRWRSLWRTHFYAGMLSMPLLVLFALTGLFILYTQPIQDLFQDDWRTVPSSSRSVSLDDQRAEVEDAYDGFEIASVTPPRDGEHSTVFSGTAADGSFRDVFVDPHSGEVLGSSKPGDDIVGLANRLHGFLNNETVTVKLPMLAGLLHDGEPILAEVPVTEIALEIAAVWGLTMALTGVYLWWPRKRGTGKALIKPRLGKPGRARWRDLHAVGGVLLAGLIVFFVMSGMPWSSYWGSNWATVATEVTPNEKPSFWEWEGPTSAVPTVGDLDRVGNRIPWATNQEEVPASDPSSPHHGTGSGEEAAGGGDGPPTKLASLDLIATAATDEGMKPGFTINMPADVLEDPDEPRYGAFAVFNPWPGRMSNQGALYLDQFSGRTIAHSTAATWGALQWTTELGVQTHMGTQFGVVSRILMTAGCLLILWMATTAIVMWWKRRPSGKAGLPRRPNDVRTPKSVLVVAVVLGLLYPLWGISALLILLADRYVIRSVPPLRRAFGMR
ncbi:MAG: PepSY domain-containing protein [Actinobacteria bacterium]|nr:PepSY domain-containing protein [Actinomycetota bacterium]